MLVNYQNNKNVGVYLSKARAKPIPIFIGLAPIIIYPYTSKL